MTQDDDLLKAMGEAQTKKTRPPSRPARWADACSAANAALSQLEMAIADYNTALEELRDIQEEYSEWRDNLPESLQSSPLGEKLEAVCDLDLSEFDDLDGARGVVDEAEAMDLPRGFGND